MLLIAQYILLSLYVALPILAIGYALHARIRHGRVWPMASLIFSCMAGSAVALSILYLNRWLMGGTIRTLEYVRAIYVAVAVLCLLKFIDHWMLRGVFRLGRVPLDPYARPASPNHPRALAILFVQRILMLVVVVCYVFALLLAYRPRVTVAGNPSEGKEPMEYVKVSFTSADGIPLTGWWIAAAKMPNLLDADVAGHWGKRSVLLCHGIGAGKERLLELARPLARNGFNVFLFDFRGHGESGGNFVSYGDRERLDVLAAAKWVRANHAYETEKLFGIGMNTGAAALVGAAADDKAGHFLDGLVLYEPFARFDVTADAAASRTLPPTVRWFVRNVSLPFAGLHAGSDLNDFAPMEKIDRVWPRPVLVVHGRGETFVPTTQTMELFQQAAYPKEQFWPADNYYDRIRRQRTSMQNGNYSALSEMLKEYLGTADLLGADPGVLRRTLRFLHEAETVPVI